MINNIVSTDLSVLSWLVARGKIDTSSVGLKEAGFNSGLRSFKRPPLTYGLTCAPHRGMSVLLNENFRSCAGANRGLKPGIAPNLSLGLEVAACNGAHPNGANVVVIHNLIAGLRNSDRLPIQVDPFPEFSTTTSLLALPCLSTKEDILCVTPQPGLVDYYRQIGLLSPSSQVFTVGAAATGHLSGYPYLDPLTLAESHRLNFGGKLGVSCFTSPHIREQMEALGLKPVQQSDSFYSNNKAVLRQDAASYSIEMLPGMVLTGWDDVQEAVQRFSSSRVWIKFSNSLGGDLLLPIEAPLTEAKLIKAREIIRQKVAKGLAANDYGGMTIEEFWPADSFASERCAVVVEQDANALGTIVANGSNVLSISWDGNMRVPSFFRQLTSDGIFLGSMSFDPEQELVPSVYQALMTQCHAIGRYCASKLNLYGVVGVDFMLIKPHNSACDQDLRVFIIELNGRPPISSCSYIAAQKLGAKSWVARDVKAPQHLLTMADFEQAVTIDGQNYARSRPEEGMLVPLMFSTLYGGPADKPVLMQGSGLVKVLVAGPTVSRCQEMLAQLEAQGFNLTPYSRGEDA